jgi:hypothetical protein
MTAAALAAIFTFLAKAFPSVFTFVAGLIAGGKPIDEAEIKKRLDAIDPSEAKGDAEVDAILARKAEAPGVAPSASASVLDGLTPKNPHASER